MVSLSHSLDAGRRIQSRSAWDSFDPIPYFDHHYLLSCRMLKEEKTSRTEDSLNLSQVA